MSRTSVSPASHTALQLTSQVARITAGLCIGGPNAFASSSRVLLRPRAAPHHFRAPRTTLVVRLASTTSAPPPDHDDRPQARTRGKNHRCVEGMSDGQRRAYYQLRPVVDAFKAPVDLAIAYGSGVVAQANAAPGVSGTHEHRGGITLCSSSLGFLVSLVL